MSNKLSPEEVYRDGVVDGYLTCMLWAETDGDEPLDDNYSVVDLAPSALTALLAQVDTFLEHDDLPAVLACYPPSQIGHDLWLTQHHHGAGFWDGDYRKDHELILMAHVKSMPELYPYAGDDGLIYIGGHE